MSKSALASIVGRPSAGKSTLLNRFCGEMVSIVTPLPQTTRNKIRGIVNRPQGQIVFLDTPGFHDSEKKFNQQLRSLVQNALDESDMVLYVIDRSRAPGQEERELLSLLDQVSQPVVIALNKCDLPAHPGWQEFLHQPLYEKAKILEISAQLDQGLEPLLDLLYDLAPEGEPYYPEEYYTDQEPVFRISEVIREQAMLRTREEIPHAIYVEIADLEEDQEQNQLWIRAFLVVERESQKGIVVGKGGEGIKKIRQESQKILGRIFPQRIHLDLRVKANPKWRNKDQIIRKLLH